MMDLESRVPEGQPWPRWSLAMEPRQFHSWNWSQQPLLCEKEQWYASIQTFWSGLRLAQSTYTVIESRDVCSLLVILPSLSACKFFLESYFISCRRRWVWSSLLSSKRTDAELKTREANVREETRPPNRGFVSIFIKLSSYYPCGEREENKILPTWMWRKQSVIINLCV